MKKILILSGLLLSGCVSQQEIKDFNFSDTNQKILIEEINRIDKKEINYEEIEINLATFENTNDFPQTKISFNFTTSSKLKDLLDIFDFYKINVVVSNDIDINQNIVINRYSGNLDNLLNAISENTNLTFEYKNKIVYVKNERAYKIKIVQDIDVINSIFEQLKELEIKELVKSENAGLISFKSDFKTFQKIKDVVNEINNNTSLINFDISLINVFMNENEGNGFDWETLNLGANLDLENLTDQGFNLTNGNKLGFKNSNFSVSVVANILNSYGTTETLQSTSIKTLSGREATFKTTETTPFISGITNTTNGDYSQQGFSTETTETGLDIKILPYFDKQAKIVNASITLNKSSLKSFLTIINDNNEIKQPQTEQQEFNSVIRLRAGETSVIGGIIYYSENKTGNNIISEFTQSNKKELVKNALFIILKPSVKSYIYK
ncbi:hypothetical protein HYO11_18735 [Vibrio parahaemolyticus]|nr:hypothetical protein [Vibrio parahaemolyticus]